MTRQIVGFHRDPKNDWGADLDCGHWQHVRHNPPFENRPWTMTEGAEIETWSNAQLCALR